MRKVQRSDLSWIQFESVAKFFRLWIRRSFLLFLILFPSLCRQESRGLQHKYCVLSPPIFALLFDCILLPAIILISDRQRVTFDIRREACCLTTGVRECRTKNSRRCTSAECEKLWYPMKAQYTCFFVLG